jgi:hypothetical protein
MRILASAGGRVYLGTSGRGILCGDPAESR